MWKRNADSEIWNSKKKELFRRRGVAVESLPSNPAAVARFPAESEILISIVVLGVSFACVVFGGGPDILLTTVFRQACPCVSD